MKSKQSKTLWAVDWTARGRYGVEPSLWILGDTAEIAARKARRALKRASDNLGNPFKGVIIKSVVIRGTIVAF